MNLDFSVDHGAIEVYHSLPKELVHLAMPGAHTVHIKTDFAKAFFHCYKGDGYRVWINKIHSSADGYINSRGNFSVIEYSYALSGQLEGKWDGMYNAGLMPRTFNIRSTPHVLTRARFRKNRNYHTFEIEFEDKFIKKLGKRYPLFNYFLDLVRKGEPTQLCPRHLPSTRLMDDAIRDFMRNRYHPVLQPMLLERCVTQILLEAFQLAFFADEPDPGFIKPHEEEQLYKARTMIIEQPVHMPLTIEELCRKLNMREDKLFNGFRELFNITPGKFQTECKFRQIEQWLLEGHSPSSVSNLAGYGSVPTFYDAFGERYKCTPTEWQMSMGVKQKKRK